jgi:large subunit ribosomal protein L35
VTGTGKILRRPTMRSHNLEHKPSKRKRRFRKEVGVTKADYPALKKMLRIK